MKFYQRGLNLFLFVVFLGIPIAPVYAQFSILPYADEKANCKQLLDRYELDRKIPTKEAAEAGKKKTPERDNLLGCAIKTGRISFAMIPYFITYIINFLLALSGLVSVLFIVVGGFQYVYGGLSEHKDKAKKTIQHALMGMAVSILAWSIVNVIIGAITG